MRFRQSLSQEQFDNSTIAFIPFDLRPSLVTINKLSRFVSAQFLLWRPCRARESGRETRSRRKMRRTIRYSVAALPPLHAKALTIVRAFRYGTYIVIMILSNFENFYEIGKKFSFHIDDPPFPLSLAMSIVRK